MVSKGLSSTPIKCQDPPHISFKVEKAKNGKVVVNTWKHRLGHRVLSVCKTKIQTEYREKGIKCLKNLIFQTYQFS